MSGKKIKKITNFINSFLKKRKIKIDKIILFGSCSRTDSIEGSDVDTAIVSSVFNEKDIFQRARILKGLDWSLVGEFMIPFDIIPLSLKEWKESSSPMVGFVREGQEVLSF